jgi:hypothetical protein
MQAALSPHPVEFFFWRFNRRYREIETGDREIGIGFVKVRRTWFAGHGGYDSIGVRDHQVNVGNLNVGYGEA